MSLPVRCFSCNKSIGHLEEKFNDKVEKGENMEKILNDFGLTRYCCRRMFLGYVDFTKQLLKFPKNYNFDNSK